MADGVRGVVSRGVVENDEFGVGPLLSGDGIEALGQVGGVIEAESEERYFRLRWHVMGRVGGRREEVQRNGRAAAGWRT